MKRIFSLIFLLFGLLYILPAQTRENPLVIKIGSVTPKGSDWDRVVKQIVTDWMRISDGRVEVVLYSGSVAGAEEDMIRKVRFNQLEGAIVTNMGFNAIDPDFMVFSLPFLFQSQAELDHVMESIRPLVESKIEKKRFRMAGWSFAGWAKFFSRDSVVYPVDLKKQKLGVTPADETLNDAWKSLGYKTVPINMPDMIMGLQRGTCDAFITAPMAAAGYQVFTLANQMLDIEVAPMIGVFVLSDKVYRALPDDLRDTFMEVAEKNLQPLYDQSAALDAKAMNLMLGMGLTVNSAPDAARRIWEEEMADAYEKIIRKKSSREFLEAINTLTEDYRK